MTTRRVYHVSILVPGVYVGKGGGACKVFQNVERGGACTKCGGFCATQTLQGIEAPSRSLKRSKDLVCMFGPFVRTPPPLFSLLV